MLSPLTIEFKDESQVGSWRNVEILPFTTSSIEDGIVLNITTIEYADVVPMMEIMEAQEIKSSIKLIKNSNIMNKVREKVNDTIDLLYLFVCNELILIVDSNRDLKIKNNSN